MKRLLSCAQAAGLDREVQERVGFLPGILMEDASIRLWDAFCPLTEARGPDLLLTALCGSGNNAGDALAMLRHARFAGFRNLAVVVGSPRPGELALVQLEYLRALGVTLLSWAEDEPACRALLRRSDILLDGLAGTGLRGSLREPLASLLRAVEESGVPVAAVDIPSGLSDGFAPGHPVLPARWTLAIEPLKAALYFPAARLSCGEILPVGGIFPANIGDYVEAAPSIELLEEEDLRRMAPSPPVDAHKGTRGRVAVFAGSIGATGAPAMAAQSSLASGAGLVAIFASPEILPILSAKLDAVMVKPEPERLEALDTEHWDAFLLGPGWGATPKNARTLGQVLATGRPAVLDADAIGLYGALRADGLQPRGPLVLTPHPGEFSHLTGIPVEEALANPAAVLPGVARSYGAVIVLKSHCTWIASPGGRLAVWEGMDSALATAGSGDVLAGVAAALIAAALKRAAAAGGAASAAVSGTASAAAGGAASAAAGGAASAEAATFEAACAAVIAHGLAGRRARAASGFFQAPALIEEIGRVLGRTGLA